jgi:hypothetical protein
VPLCSLSPPKAARINSPALVRNGAGLQKTSESKEFKMIRNYLFNVFIVIALVVMVVLAISQAIETTKVVSAASGASNETYCLSGMDRFSLTSVYIERVGGWYPRTNSGFTGFDGGLMHLLSTHHACSSSK